MPGKFANHHAPVKVNRLLVIMSPNRWGLVAGRQCRKTTARRLEDGSAQIKGGKQDDGTNYIRGEYAAT